MIAHVVLLLFMSIIDGIQPQEPIPTRESLDHESVESEFEEDETDVERLEPYIDTASESKSEPCTTKVPTSGSNITINTTAANNGIQTVSTKQSENAPFPWMYVAIGSGILLVLCIILIGICVCYTIYFSLVFRLLSNDESMPRVQLFCS